MSNPLVLHGTQISIPKPRPQPLPRIPEDSSDSAAQQAGPLSIAQGGASMGQGVSAANGAPAEAPPAPFRSASNSSMFTPSSSQPIKSLGKGAHMTRDSDGPKERALNADERLQRLKLRMQSTIQAYSGNLSSAGSAGRYTRTQSMTAASPHAVFQRTNSSPTRPSMVSLYGASRNAMEDASSNHSSSSCSSATSPASGQSSVKGGVSRGGAVPDDRTLLQAKSMSSKRGIPQVRSCHLLPFHSTGCLSRPAVLQSSSCPDDDAWQA